MTVLASPDDVRTIQNLCQDLSLRLGGPPLNVSLVTRALWAILADAALIGLGRPLALPVVGKDDAVQPVDRSRRITIDAYDRKHDPKGSSMARRRKRWKIQSKTLCQRIHFKRRASARYDLDVNRHLYREMVQMIQNNKAVLINRQSNRVALYRINLLNPALSILVIYDRNRKTLVTALPEAKSIDLPNPHP
ncbi:MAG: hypothetical protein ACRC1K_03950 [Planctomycetia bacterium]